MIIRHDFPIPMHTGSELLETWIPDGGFEIAKRKLKTSDGGSALADCLVAKWPDDELAGRWFLRGTAGRSDKRFCSNACKNRAFRRNYSLR